MKVDAIKLVAAATMAGIDPTDEEQAAAAGEAVELALGFVANVERIADALERLASVVDDGRGYGSELRAFHRDA